MKCGAMGGGGGRHLEGTHWELADHIENVIGNMWASHREHRPSRAYSIVQNT
jgi:hypothetical protein